MRHDYDVIVVGARVAGASTAMLLARRGHRVLVVDRAPRSTDALSTHAVLRSGVLQLSRWGILDQVIAAGTPAIREVVLGFGEDRVSFDFRPDFGVDAMYAPRRTVLDPALVAGAEESGAELMTGTRVTGLVREDDGRVGGVLIGVGRRTRSVTAPMVIGADGTYSRFADWVAAPMQIRHELTNAMHFAYFTGIDGPQFWSMFDGGVSAGIFATNDEMSLVFVGRSPDRMPAWRGDPDGEFRRLLGQAGADIAGHVDGGTRMTEYRGTPGIPCFLRVPWGKGWALVGDSGYTKDPISAHGISDALRDAELCARAVDQALQRPDRRDEAMREYHRLRDLFAWPLFQESRELASYRWTPPEASERMRTLSSIVQDECRLLAGLPEWPRVASALSA